MHELYSSRGIRSRSIAVTPFTEVIRRNKNHSLHRAIPRSPTASQNHDFWHQEARPLLFFTPRHRPSSAQCSRWPRHCNIQLLKLQSKSANSAQIPCYTWSYLAIPCRTVLLNAVQTIPFILALCPLHAFHAMLFKIAIPFHAMLLKLCHNALCGRILGNSSRNCLLNTAAASYVHLLHYSFSEPWFSRCCCLH